MKDRLTSIGVEYEETLKRFMGKEDFFLRMLKKFLDDQNYVKLKQAVSDKNWPEAFTHAHTVKGLCGNLSLGNMLEYVVPLTEELRNAPYDEEKIVSYMEGVDKAYAQTVEVIRSL